MYASNRSLYLSPIEKPLYPDLTCSRYVPIPDGWIDIEGSAPPRYDIGRQQIQDTRYPNRNRQGPQKIANVDWSQYTGTWYEMASLPMPFEIGCIGAKAEYIMTGPNTISVRNTCITQRGRDRTATAEATVLGPGRAYVDFSKGFGEFFGANKELGNYWVLEVDPYYRWAIVGGPDKDAAWILSRTPNMDQRLLSSLVQNLQDRGYDTSKLIYRSPNAYQ